MNNKEKLNETIPKSERVRGIKILHFDAVQGTGRVVTSSRSVHGKDSKFMTEVKNGNTLLFFNQTTKETDEAIISMVFSDKSQSLKEPMASNVITYSTFQIKRKDEEVEEDMNTDEIYQDRLNSLNKKVKKSKTILELKSKKGMWGYKTEKEEFRGELSREEMLDQRSPGKGDKWCS